ncbi:GNAT family N-acetyltransferase [Muricauda sp. CAU 1633]|uniref:GNAT family N-acetyltransferase n=1 Tax=Allomuricauda sp. CAU 1633 TaxID=2816036 RepID=UPI001A8CBA1B|nr:GNAT family N-acetyltransferase [Muricauda sp. CAU 1633]MBO0322396.1 GNAT family N-acetyltransferase [Muricauda sp. CAU 1633]
MIDNPFLSETFTKIWAKSFSKENTPIEVKGVFGPKFYMGKWGIHTNYGKTHTKGMQYTLEHSLALKKETLLIFDVPTYFNIPQPQGVKPTKLLRIKQYPGFLIELDSFSSLQDYLQKKFKKSSRYKLNKYSRRLSECFDIKAKMHVGDITQGEYDLLFDRFRKLLEKRFLDKEEYNNNLDEKEWDFYKKVAYPMIIKNEAGLFVVKNGDLPIAITLVYFSKDIIFDAITVFDIDYAKFHLGSVNIMHLIDWGITNKFQILDFSKGYFDYKTRWATRDYNFEYHILYNSESLSSTAKAVMAKNYFKLKQYLREKDLNRLLNKALFSFRKKKWDSENTIDEKGKTVVFEEAEVQDDSALQPTDGYSPQVIKLFFDFLYLNNESAKDVEVYRGSNGQYLFRGKNSKKVARLT